MSCEIPETSEPIIDAADLPPELLEQFLEVYFETISMIESVRAADVALFHEKVTKEVKANPIFARASFQQSTLLDIVCSKVGSAGLETIQFLIEANPHALLYRNSDDERAAIHLLAYSGWGSGLLPWIMERHPWVFQHEICQQNAHHLEMAISYANGICDLKTVRKVYGRYPRWLTEQSNSARTYMDYPLTASLRGRVEPDAEFFIWMAKQCPGAVYVELEEGCSVLHMVCDYLTRDYYTPNMAKTCRFLISEHPGLICKNGDAGILPIYMLAHRCNRPMVQEVALLLLKEHPECVQVMVLEPFAQLSTFPFIQQVHPLVVQELEVDQEINQLIELSENVAKAAVSPIKQSTFVSASNGSVSTSGLLGSLSEVFCSWANLRASDVLSAKKKRIQEHIAGTCRLLEGEDSDESEADVDPDEDDSNEDLESEDEEDDDDDTEAKSSDVDHVSVSENEVDDDGPDESNEEVLNEDETEAMKSNAKAANCEDDDDDLLSFFAAYK